MLHSSSNPLLDDQHVERLAELGLVSASIIHEVKNALQGIANALLLLEHDQSIGPKSREWIAVAQRELLRALDASRQTLSLVRNEALRKVRVSSLLDDVLEVYAGKAPYKSVAIERRYDFQGEIEAAPDSIREVFANIVLNALESLPARGGKLLVRTSARRRSNGRHVAGVQIVFADNGPGIPDKNKKKIFEPLFSTRKGTGTGLGLWICRQLVRQHHGHLWLISKTRGAGCCFLIFLPVRQKSKPLSSVSPAKVAVPEAPRL